MLTLLVMGMMGFVALAVLGLLASVVALVWWLIFLPFRVLGWVFGGLAGLLALPFMLVFALLAMVLFAAGFIAFAIPLLPFALLVGGIWWLMKRRHPGPVRT